MNDLTRIVMANLTIRLAHGPIGRTDSSVSQQGHSEGTPDRTGDRLNQATAELHAELLSQAKPLDVASPGPRAEGPRPEMPRQSPLKGSKVTGNNLASQNRPGQYRPGRNQPDNGPVSQSGTIRLSDLAARKR